MRSTASRGDRPVFSEKAFYLSEFRSRTLAMALPEPDSAQLEAVRPVLDEFTANATRVILVSDAPPELLADSAVLRAPSVATLDGRWVGALWRQLRSGGLAVLGADRPETIPSLCREVALRLGLAKLVWVEEQAVLQRPDGSRLSFLDLRELDALLAGPPAGSGSLRRELLTEIRAMVAGGLPSVSICSPSGLAAELFTYAGSGTFFTRERAPLVRPLVLDDFDAAHDLIGHGVSEGYLVARSSEELEDVLTHGFGVFIEGRYLAGIGALLLHPDPGAGEIASLYTVTRFLREGVGGHLVRFALERARELGHHYVFACTTSERVAGFFVRHGFRRVGPEAIPPSKWKGYPPERRALLRCLRCDV